MIRVLAVLAGLVLLGQPARAQQRIFAVIDAPDGLSNTLWEARVDEGRVSDVRLRAITPGRGSGPATSAGGQMVLWETFSSPNYSLAIFDRSSGTTLVAPGLSGDVLDPTRPRMFAVLNGTIVSVTPAGTVVVPGTSGMSPVGVSADGTRLYAIRMVSAGPPPTYDLVGIDPDSGISSSAISIGTNPGSIQPAPDGSTVWLVSATPDDPDLPLLRRFEWPSGEERIRITLARSTPPVEILTHWIVGVDSSRHRIVMAMSRSPYRFSAPGAGLKILDTETGAPVTGWFGMLALGGIIRARLDLGAGEILCMSQIYDLNPRDAWLLRYSVQAGEELSRQPLGNTTPTGGHSYLGNLSFALPPRPPVLDAPTVPPSRVVTLAWTRAPELTLGFTVEAGSAPGLSNLAVLPVTGGTTLVVPNVPPGTYYVRVRASNYIGGSAPSNEVVVEVR